MLARRPILLALIVFITLSLAAPLTVQAAPPPQDTTDLAARIAALETAVAELTAQNAVLTERIAALEAALTPTPAAAETAESEAATEPTATPPAAEEPATSRSSNVRQGPGTDYPIVTTLAADAPLTIVGRNEAGDWYQIETAARAGWIAATLVSNAPALDTIPLATDILPAPTPEPADTAAPATPAAAAAGGPLNVSFINPHYNCTRGDGVDDFYRYFQIDLFIENTSGQTITAPWKPSRWIITDGVNERIDETMLQWCNRFSGCYEQPDIEPGGSAGWTWVNERAELYEWVKAVEFDYGGRTYRQDFPDNALNRAEWNYGACPN